MAYISTSRAHGRPTRRFGLMAYIDLFRQRRTLSRLDDHQLDDIGLTRHEAEIEAARPIWDSPSHWR